jgi:DNA-binding NarL/FixJ family response regulator
MSALAVLLIEAHVLLRQHIAGFLRNADDDSIIVTAIGLLDELEQIQLCALRPDVILLGAESNAAMIDQAIAHVRGCLPAVPIVVLGMLDADEYRSVALAAGADAFLVKETLNVNLLPTIQQTMRAVQQRCI